MHQKDYELAEHCLQELREGRSRELTAADVQDIAGHMIAATGAVGSKSGSSVAACGDALSEAPGRVFGTPDPALCAH
jgi:hypothetical protein